MTAITKDDFSTLELFTTLFIALVAHKNLWYFDIEATNYFCNARNTFISYINIIILQAIKGIGRSIGFLEKGTVCLNIQFTNHNYIY